MLKPKEKNQSLPIDPQKYTLEIRFDSLDFFGSFLCHSLSRAKQTGNKNEQRE